MTCSSEVCCVSYKILKQLKPLGEYKNNQLQLFLKVPVDINTLDIPNDGYIPQLAESFKMMKCKNDNIRVIKIPWLGTVQYNENAAIRYLKRCGYDCDWNNKEDEPDYIKIINRLINSHLAHCATLKNN